jgi:general secretion pathway protein H
LVSADRQSGMTLLELLVVLAVLSLMAAVASPYIGRNQGRWALRNATHEIAAALREARGNAVMRNRTEFFVGDIATGRFWATGSAKRHALPAGVAMTLHTTVEQRLGDEAGSITFWPDGSSTGGGVMLAQDDRKVMVQVDWLTGRVSTNDAPPDRRTR